MIRAETQKKVTEEMLKLSEEGIKPNAAQFTFINDLLCGRIPWTPPPINNEFGRYYLRSLITKNLGMWGFVHRAFCQKLAAWIGDRKVIEVMAGVGWLAKGLSEQGVDIVATDNHSWNTNIGKGHGGAGIIHPVVEKDAVMAAAGAVDKDILIISWPYTDDTCYDVIEAWGTDRPIIYIGEWLGCTASDKFLAHFDTIEEQDNFDYWTWDGLYDYPYIGYFTGKPMREYEVSKYNEED